ncbi:MAG: DMT family transporter [Alphaproteobacteria bacterium]|nr:DMT family transporter [Alphaproteobacteria bacterium]
MSFIERHFPKDAKHRGIIFALIAMMLFSCMAAIAKHFAGSYSAFQIAFFRFFFALFPLFPLIVSSGGLDVFKTQRFFGHVWRSVVGTASLICYFYSLQHLPLADAVAVSFTNPIFITLLSMVLLKEKVGINKWIAIALGFIGVLIIAKPDGLTLNIGVFYGLASSLFYALAMISLRTLGGTEKVLTTTTYFTVLASCMLAIPAALSWVAPSFIDLMIFILCGLLAGIGQLFLTSAYQNAPPSVISPFNYSSILWAVIIGFLAWGQIPQLHVWIGAAIVIATGIYILQQQNIKPNDAPPAEPL